MQKIQELVKEGKLSKNLISDKEFVAGAKEIFKSEKIEMDDEKLKQLMDQIEAQLKQSDIMSDKELESVSGGVDWKAAGKSAARKTIKTVRTVIGATIGAIAGAASGVEVAKMMRNTDNQVIILGICGAGFGLTGGGYAGYKLGKWICKKTGLEEDLEED